MRALPPSAAAIRPRRSRAVLEDIEPRILYSADHPAALVAAPLLAVYEAASVKQPQATAAEQPTASELVFIDAGVPDADMLAHDIAAQAAAGRQIEVVRIGENQDGIAVITSTLAARSDVTAVHVLAHGSAGAVQLGNTVLDQDALLLRAGELAGWSAHLSASADLLIYGCDVAADAQGRALVQGLAQLTGADVAASEDLTGFSGLGGNWTLEMQTGQIEAQIAIGLRMQAQWQGVLATYTVTNTNDSGAGSLRQAILDSNATTTVDDTIAFNITGTGVHTITLTSALPSITDTVILNATTDDSFAANSNQPAIILDGNGLNSDGLVLASGSGGSTIRGLVVRNFDLDGIQINSGSTGNTIAGNYIGSLAATGGGGGVGNGGAGLNVLGANNTIGGTTAADRNLISGNANGIIVSAASGNQVVGNFIGTNLAGTAAIANTSDGIRIEAGSTGNTVGGSNTNQRNIIAGNGGEGIQIDGETSDGNTIKGNWVGVGADGATLLGTGGVGIYVGAGADNTVVGGAGANDGNWVAGTAFTGIELDGTITGSLVQGNRIGTDAAGTANWGTQESGILIENSGSGGGPSSNLVEDNIVAFSGQGNVFTSGLWIRSTAGAGNTLLRNVFYSNVGLGIDLDAAGVTANDAGDTDTGPNNLQNYPVLTLAKTDAAGQITVSGTLSTNTGTNYYRVEFFATPTGDANGFGEGQTYLGFVNVPTTGGTGSFSTTLSATVPVGYAITATATKSDAAYTTFTDTSEFAHNVVAISSVQATIVVDTATDTNDGVTTSLSTLLANKGADGLISLREAITAANNTANGTGGADRISFGIAGTGVHTITLSTALPDITGAVILDASTDDSFAANGNKPAIVLNGNNLSTSVLELGSTADGSTVRGFVITNTQLYGIHIQAGSDNNLIAGNYIGGLTSAGTSGSTTVRMGIVVEGAGNTIGGTTAADRNVISGASGTGTAGRGIRIINNTATGNLIEGNYIGTDAAGTTAIANSIYGIEVLTNANGNTIGGTTVAQRNVIGAASGATAIDINNASNTIVQGNYIGVGSDGTTDIGGGVGVLFGNATTGTQIGGAAAGAGNLIANTTNGRAGILLTAGSPAVASILGNSIYSTAGLGIDLSNDGVTLNDTGDADTGSNGLQNFPVLTVAKTDASGQVAVSGTLNSSASSYYRVEFFASPTGNASHYGGGQSYLGFVNVTTDSSGNAIFSTTLSATVPVGYVVSATATKSDAAFTTYTYTSEFARNVLAVSSVQNTLVVDTAADTLDGDITSLSTLLANKGADGFVSLREAITAANNTANGTGGADQISFGIAGTGIHTITLASVLPSITEAVKIDGTTEAGYTGSPLIALNGAGSSNSLLTLAAGSSGSTVRGLDLQNFAGYGLYINGSSGNTVAGNYLGIDAGGTTASGTSTNPITLNNSNNNVIGGSTTADRNVIAGNYYSGVLVTGTSTGNLIQGNYFGINAAGTAIVGAATIQVEMNAPGNTLGGTSAGQGNVIAGQINGAGVYVQLWAPATGTTVQGNLIGLNAAGTAALTQGSGTSDGIFVHSSNNTIGGTTAGARNVIGGVAGYGIDIDNAGSGGTNNTIQGNYIGTDITGTALVANGRGGVRVQTGAANNTIGGTAAGAGNLITGNSGTGVYVTNTAGTGNAILGNSINGNTGLGIDLQGGTENPYGVTANDAGDADTGANNLQNFAVLSAAQTNGSSQLLVVGTLNSTAASYYRLEFFASATADASGYGEGRTYLGFVNVATDGAGSASFSATLAASVALGTSVAATATRSNAAFNTFTDTSEFSAVQAAAGPVVHTVPGAQSIAEDVGTAIGGISVSALFASAISTALAVSNGTLLVSLAGGASIGAGSNGSAALTLSGTVAQVNAALATLQYTGASNYNGSDSLSVTTSDGAGASDADNVAITVTAVNDAPVITSNGAGATAAINVAENGTAVATVTATDVDGPTLAYSISGGADAARFQINASTGALSFVAAPDFENPTDAGANNVYDVTVRVSDGSLADTQAIAVTVTNLNDNTPVITSNGGGATAGVSTAENATAVTTVVATDADGPSLSYSIVGGADAARFQINSSTGALSFVAAPDYENPLDAGANNVYDVTVQASDGLLADTQAIAVTVTNLNDTAPVITSDGGGTSASLNVAENGTTVTTVAATDADGSALAYSISGGADAALFQINSSTGALSFISARDFESPTDAGANNVYDVTVRVSDGTFTDTQALGVTVTNVNDNAPVITSNGGGATASVSTPENGTVVTTVVASDADGSAVAYSIVGGADAARFQINSSTGVLSFVAAPDFESPTDVGANNVYDVTVQASDGLLADTQAIAVTVTNLNDSTPVITSNGGGASAAINVAENATAVTTVVATDADGSALAYSISGGADAALFQINASTGALSFIAAPDFENPTDAGANNVYNVTVRASDGVANDTQALAVTVTDVNDNAPVITSNGAGATASVSTPENGTAVTTVTASDVDGPTLAYSIVGGADAALFQINAATGALSFVAAPDFESPTDVGANNVYDVTVQVSDGSLTDAQAIAVTVTNLNDSAPVITSNGGGASAALNVAENGVAVTTVTASDADGSALAYSISGGADAALFQINASTGALSFIAAPDFENPADAGANNVYDVTVRVSDGSQADTQAIAVTVTDLNDNAPVITSSGGGATANVSTPENGTAVTTVTASDVDGPTLAYSIAGGADAALFQINASTGALSFVAAPDFEGPTDTGANNVYDVTVRVSDGSLTNTQAIAVTVTNLNDNAPVITSNGGGATANVSTPENGTVVTTVVATDADGPTVAYSIVGGADAARFQINSSTGVLSFVAAPDFESPTDVGANNVYDVTVQASDGLLADTQAIAVTVTNLNDSTPVITSNGGGASAAINVAENATAVTTVVATDADGSALAYSISGGADAALFQINASTGALSFIAAPDFENPTDAGANNVYNVTVRASDGVANDTQALAVTVTDVNDNAPVITSNGAGASASVSTPENGTAVTTVTASDVDGPTLAYSIVGGADAALFQINAATGALSFVAAPDFESPTDVGANNIYDVTVQVSDGSLTDTQAIAVTVTNLNDSAPVITSNGGGASAAINVTENGVAVTTVTASDADGSALAYSISGGADAALFQINASTGALSFVAATDFENPADAGANNVYDVTVRVSDGSQAGTQAIAVTVTDLNDNAPVITSNGGGATANVSTPENGTAVTTVTAGDVDGPTLSYSIVGGADAALFQINASTGALSFVAAPDFESPTDAGINNVYDVTVQVSDGSLTDTQAIAVTVTNLNDNAPVITSNGGGATASVSTPENGTVVTTVVATDADGSALAYSIVGGVDAARFQINSSTGALSFVAAPDFESPTDVGANNIYDVTVQASDGSLADTQAIAVTVSNLNDTAPVITSNGGGVSASVNMAENGTAATTVVATDADGSALAYSISGGADAALFQINASTGALSFIAAPDFENPTDAGANNVYNVTVRASDGVANDTQALAVTVTDVNDNAPVITSNGAGASASVSTPENGTAVTTVTASDVDGPTLAYSIVGGADAALFQINASTGALSFVAAPDFESPTDAGANNIYDVTVQVSDGSTTDTQDIAVTVTNLNDSAPVITSNGGGASAAINVAENGVAVTTVTASDADGSALAYSISGGADAALFQINASTGALSFIAAPDFENPTDAGANNVYDVTVRVSDGSQADTQAIAVTVTDLNDNPPVITSNGGGATANVSTPENGTAVTTVTAGDVDGPTLAYSIVGGADAALFQINASTGALSFVAAPDFESPTDAGINNVYDVTVRVSDGSLADTQAIAVTVTNLNDNAPVITSNGGGATANVSVAELATAVTTVTALDADGSSLAYSIVGGADAALFQINATSGALRFVGAPDFENPQDADLDNVYDVQVRVSDGVATDTQAIAVTVTDVNDNGPNITSDGGGVTASVSVAENTTAVTTVAASDADTPVLSFSISGGADAALFAIDANTGALSFLAAPDFESPTDAGANNIYDVQVQASDGSTTDTQDIAVTVTNANDNAPVIASNGGGASVAISVAENATAVTTVAATDADGSTLGYSISGGADAALFQIDASTGALRFVSAPDFENPTDAGADNVYDVTVQASDGSATDTQALAVTVTDVNDVAPTITSNGNGASAAINVAENGTAVTTVTATDADGPSLSYSISGGADAALFQIDASTGVLRFLAAPDFEAPTDSGANNVYNLQVRVSDGTLADTQSLAVTVTDLNDIAPVITSNGGGATASVSTPENSTAVTTVTSSDIDGPPPTFSIVGGADAALFQINSSTGALRFVGAPDFENPQDAGGNNVYDVTVQSSDGNQADTQAIAVTVSNLNDSAPVITSNGGGATGTVNVAENGTAVTTVTASDADGSTLSYSIVGGADAALFQINAATGVLSFQVAPDFESPDDANADNVYDVQVRVSDGVANDTQTLAVTVTDLNDNAPVITSLGGGATASVSVAENTTAVTTVVASDVDGPTLAYSITGGADAALFAIDASTGALSFIAAPNFESPADADANNIYDVQVQASDGSSTDTQDIAVTVTNANDNAPVIASNSGGATASVSLAENATAVTTVAATDADGSTLGYSISGGADAALFQIDASTGALRFVSAPDFENPTDAGADNVYDVTVQVSDGSATDTQALAVTVTNLNDTAPVIGSNGAGPTASVNVAENTTAVTTVTALDADGSALTYTISGGADAALFQIDASTGVLRFVSAPDFENPQDAGANNVYNLQVRVSDGTLADTQNLAVTVTDLNDIAPVITSNGGGATASVSTPENSTAVTTVTSSDIDGPPPTFSIVGGADAALFQIDAGTGALRFMGAPDFESPQDAGGNNVYDVTVQSSDGNQADTQAIAVTVTNLNDSAPVITSNGGNATGTVNVAENGTAVTTVTASDADGSTLSYSIVGGADAALFQINAATGVLSFQVVPDFESPDDANADNVYDVQVRVSDGVANDTQALAVTVTDLNDNAPVINSNGGAATAGVSRPENSTAVTTVVASDVDGPTLAYSITGGADAALFAIDASTGALSFLAAPDFESPADAGTDNIYDVQVQASDGLLADTQDIAVTVTNANDNAPVITSNGGVASVAISVAENATALGTVTASDADGSTLSYSIVGGADAALFQIDSSTGALRFVSAPDFENRQDAGGNNVYDVTVQVSDGSATDTQALAVTVSDVNDVAPTITSDGAGASAAINVAENGTAVTTVTATDADGPTLSYSISGGADAALFQIDASTGVLRFVAAPDFEAPTDSGANNVYNLQVRVSDGTLADTQSLAVTVTDLNDIAPVITSNGGGATASVSTPENSTAVTTVTSSDIDGPPPTFSIVGGADATLFQIDAGTGALRFVGAPDFENPTDAGGNNVYDVTVQSSDGNQADTQAIAVTVSNLNDSAPVITSDGGNATGTVNVAENGTVVTTVTASDADGSTLSYSIVGGADAALFQINAATGVLSFQVVPDFESPDDANADNVYDVQVRVSDGVANDTQALAVTVVDVNDNAPVITSLGGGATASVSTPENSTAVTTVVASDVDGPTLAYSITGGADAALFAIDASTGALSFLAAPNFESPTDAGANNIYDVQVQASDGSTTDTQDIAVTVTDVNDVAPAITSNGGGVSAAISVTENGTAVTTVTSSDIDGPPPTFSIVGGADAALFQIDAGTGALRFVSAPDFESPQDAGGNNVYDVTVQASDGSATDTQALAVTVSDVNDVAPVITSNGGATSAAINVAENGTAVTTVGATDADGPTLSYSISGGADAALFQIDASTGVLRFVSAPDFENPQDAGTNNIYDVQVQVSDGVANDTQALAVTVTDVNDNAPVITSPGGGATAGVSTPENSTAVTTVVASDVDGPTLAYSITGGADAALFAIDASTGALSFLAAPDFESPADAGTDNIYDVQVQASDGLLADTQDIAVTVTNANDNAPVITSNGGVASVAISVAENATALGTVTASDADGSTLSYSIVGGADAALFQIDSSTGALRFVSAPDFENPADAGADNVYNVTVQVSDGSAADTQALAVTVTDVNDVAPTITSDGTGASAAINVAENSTAVTIVTATDADGPTLSYSISGGADAALFQIDASTGVLRFVSAPDFENPQDAGTHNIYDVQVQASDGSLTDTQAITVTVTNLNDNAPVITSNDGGATAGVSVAENSTAVTMVLASDADGALLSFSIVGGADAALFQIDSGTGALRFGGAPDFENPADAGADNIYDVTVQASDGSATDSQAISVTVTDVNDNAPVITSDGGGAAASVSVAENGTAVTTVAANDADGSTLSYAIVGGADAALFQINATTGVLSFQVAPDFESLDDANADNVYDVQVRVSDGVANDTQALAVTVVDVNDNAPVITSLGGGATASVSTPENSTAVTTVVASDVDGPTLAYSITGGADAALFQIDAGTGVLSFLAAPDFESPTDAGDNNIYEVQVQASDGSTTDTQDIAVTVTNANDNAPVITSNGGGVSAAISVAENGTAVTTVGATDADGPALSYSIGGGADAALFQIDAGTGALRFVSAPDFENPQDTDGNNFYDLTVQVSDGSTTDTQAIAVTVTNRNDIAPVITSNGGAAAASVSMSENAAAVTTVTATDADGPVLAYSIAGGADAALFQINTSTGALSFQVAPDFESPHDANADNVYDVQVGVSDGVANDTQTLAVTVTDLNDNAPNITSNGGGASASVSVAENTTAVTTVAATDADGPTLSYSISGGADAALFQIDANTGALRFVAAPDFENPTDAGGNNVYDVTVQASDGSFTGTQTLAVTVVDVNDNAPVISSNGGGPAANVSMDENAIAVTTVVATDMDGPTIRYGIVGGADAGLFQIDSNTGALRLMAAPDFENPQDAGADHIYDVIVRASDGSLSDTQAISVTVTDVDESGIGAVTDGNAATNQVAENAAIGTVVGITAVATDPDGTTNTISYSLVNDAGGRFQIDSGTGVVTLAAPLDYEATTSHTIRVQATGSDGSTSEKDFSITVLDVNDNAPVITSNGGAAAALLSVAENSTAVTTVTATDVDGPSLIYTISGGADAALFSIDSRTGALRFVSAPNFESPQDAGADNVYDVTVRASDGSLSDTQAVSITVTDVNESGVGPITDTDAAANTVAENASTGTVVGITVHAADADGSNNVVTYALSDSAGGRFAINTITGLVTVADGRLLDYEAATGHDFTVVATSADGSSRSQTFTVQLGNSNDNAPQITSNGGGATATVAVAENTTAVTTVAAADLDLPGQALSFRIVGGADAAFFRIDAATGVLRFVLPPDFEAPADLDADNRYEVTVQADDGGLQATQAITITVADVDEPVLPPSNTAPQIVSNGGGNTAALSITEHSTAVGVVLAVDADMPTQTLSYGIVGGADAAYFVIDGASGALRFTAPPDFKHATDVDRDNVYEVMVMVSDGAAMDTQLLLVHVMAVPEVPVVVPPIAEPATVEEPVLILVEDNTLARPATGQPSDALQVPSIAALAREISSIDRSLAARSALSGGLELLVQQEQLERGSSADGVASRPLSVVRGVNVDARFVNLALDVPVDPQRHVVEELLAALPEVDIGALRNVPTAGARRGPEAVQAAPDATTAPDGANNTALDATLVGGLVLSLSAALWASRGSALLASLLAATPAWQNFDPLPVLSRAQRRPNLRTRGALDDLGDGGTNSGDSAMRVPAGSEAASEPVPADAAAEPGAGDAIDTLERRP